MEQLINQLACKSVDLLATGGGSNDNLGIGNVADLGLGLSGFQLNFLYAVYLDDEQARFILFDHLLNIATEQFSADTNRFKVQLCIGAINAMQRNIYRSVVCYKCGGDGCVRCDGIGMKPMVKREYELCGISRNIWAKKQHKNLRLSFDILVNELLRIDADIRKIVHKNKANSTAT